MCQLSALAFLPPAEIPAAFDEMKHCMPIEANEAMEWFESSYVHSRIRKFLRGTPVRSSPIFPSKLWSVHYCNEGGFSRTQNNVEAWHRRWEKLLGGTHIGLYRIIKEF